MGEGARAVDESLDDFAIGGGLAGEDIVEDLVELVEEETSFAEAESADVLLGGLF